MTDGDPTGTDQDTARAAGFGRRLRRGVVVYGVGPYVAITLLLTISQRQMLYHPSPTSRLLVGDCGLASAASDVTTTTADGLTLHGWLLEGESTSASSGSRVSLPSDELPLVIYFPGNASNRNGRIGDLCDFTRLGCDVLIFDYRGYAENEGSPTEAALTADSRAVWRYAVNQLGRTPEQIVLFGESLGGAVGVELAAWLSRQGTPPAALITNATFDSVPSLAAAHYPVLPLRWLVWDRWSSVDRVGQITCPLLMFHGTADTLIPIEHGRRLFAAAPQRSARGIAKSFVPIEGAGHNDIPVRRLQEEVRGLLHARSEESPQSGLDRQCTQTR